MSTRLKPRRGTGAEHATFTGESGEVTLNTSAKTIVVHDGTTAGGVPMARADLANAGPIVADLIPATDITYSLGSPTNRWADLYVGNNTIYIGDNTRFSGTSLVIDGGENPTSLTELPTLIASKLVAKPFTYNPGGGSVTVRPSIEFQAVDGTSYPISFDTATNTFSLDAAGNYGTGSLVAKKITLTNDGATALRVDGNATLGYDASDALTVKAAATFQGAISATGAVSLGDGNDTIALNSGGANPVTITASNLTVDSSGNMVVGGNLTIRGTTTTIDSNTVNIGDNIIVLNADIPAAQEPTENAGIQIARGSEASARWFWDEVTDAWTPMGGNINNIGSLSVTNLNVTGTVTGITASLADSGVTAGTYTNPTITVDADGRITSAVNGTGGSGTSSDAAMVLVEERILSSAATSITFSDLNGDDDVEYEIHAAVKAGAGTIVAARFNGDSTAANYKGQFLYGSGTTIGANTENSFGGMRIGFAQSAGQQIYARLTISAVSGQQRHGLLLNGNSISNTGVTHVVGVASTWVNSVDNITSITVVSTNETGTGASVTNGLAAGTRIALYARRKVKTAGLPGYSTSEAMTGETWIDGKMIYRKTINIGTLPGTAGGTKAVNHGITGLTRVIKMYGFTNGATNDVPLPFPSTAGTNNIGVSINSTQITVGTGSASWGSATAFVTVEYTK